MDIRYLDKNFAIAPQVTPDALRDAGLATIICNRPDGEAGDQPSFADITSQAAQCGTKAYYLPVVPDKITQQDAEAFAAIISNALKPVLAYCLTGLRAQTLWQISATLREGQGSGVTIPRPG